ncbi:hypothetical protein A1O1_06428 [Capronia coronata CBS 617.96]|uniref:Rhodopsin domain-containing protein n=1 Tax=Capronia coronata CBS 617.96 TaxID=1182541 RepID=W9YUU9_9EURO|nr:uncharacterized protein A1O1_06428 [Capronia coronata CBS 617.96]EXJ86059.1 hypothetical protein A1O1_06428 [Capronia coronata CBS 617.96]
MVQDRGPATSAVTIVITVLATVFVAARFYTRLWLVKSVKQDDWWILAAWVLAVGFSTSICIAVTYGLGKHKADIADTSFGSLRKAEYAFSILYNPALMLTKTSIVVFYLSVMSKDVDPVFKWCNWLTLALVNVAGAALTFYNIFQCRPVGAGYQYPTPLGRVKCTDIVTLYLSSAPVNIVTDIAVLFLPMPILTRMRLPRKQKIILVVTFSFGAFVAAVDVIRIAYLQTAALNRLKVVRGDGGTTTRVVEQNDFSWYASLSFMWSAVEVCIGIICACVPSLKPLFSRFLPSFIRDPGDDLTSSDSADHGKPDASSSSPDTRTALRGNVSMVTNPAAFRSPSVKEYTGDDDGDQMGFLNMLAAPPDKDDDDGGVSFTVRRTTTATSRLTRRDTNKTTVSDFGFVKMSGSRNMLKLSSAQSIWPIAVVTGIFFLWGCAYGLLDTLNSRFQTVAGLSTGQVLGLHAAYFAGYLVGPLTLGLFIIKRYGFKAVMISGLCVYGCGTLVFWPSAVLTSYGAFIVSNFLVGYGLACLEVAANPYIALCGPLEYAEVRLNVSQAFQAIGTVCSPLLATRVLFKNVLDASSLVNVQWTYLGIALFVFALAVVFYYIPLPEATDEQLQEMADKRSAAYRAAPVPVVGIPWRVVYTTLALGVFSQWCYVGLQECVGNNLQPLITLLKPGSDLHPFYFLTIGHTVFTVGRFATALLNYLFKPRWVLLALFIGLVVCLSLNMELEGNAGAVFGILTFLFEAGIFSNIFASSMRGLGAQTKLGSALMTAAISGGAVFPPIQWGVANGRGLRYSYCVPLAVAVFGMLFPLYLNLVPEARAQVDPTREEHAQRHRRTVLQQERESGSYDQQQRPGYEQAMMAKRRRKTRQSGKPSVEHVEQRTSSRNGTLSASSSPVLTMDFADYEKREIVTRKLEPVRTRSSQGYTGELALWPADQSSERNNSVGTSSGRAREAEGSDGDGGKYRDRQTRAHEEEKDERDDSDSMVTHHQPAPTHAASASYEVRNDDEIDDDYHAFMRQK